MPKTFTLSLTDLTILFGMWQAQVKSGRKLVSMPELYAQCPQQPNNVRWVLSRLKNITGMITNQRVDGIGTVWVWCGRKTLGRFLTDALEDQQNYISRPERARLLPKVADLKKALQKAETTSKAA